MDPNTRRRWARTGMVSIACLLAMSATAAADRGDSEISVAVVPLDFAWYFGYHPAFSDGKIDEVSDFAMGATAAYLTSISPSWEVGPRLTVITPRLDTASSMVGATGLLTLRTTRPFAGGDGRFSLGLHGGVNVTSIENPGGGTSRSVGLTLGPVVGLRLYMGSNFWLAIDGNVDLTQSVGEREYEQDIIRLSSLGVGVAYRPGPQEQVTALTEPNGTSIAAVYEVHSIPDITLTALPFFGARYTRRLVGRLALEGRASTNVYLTAAQAGLVYELTGGSFIPYGFARAGAMLGLEDNFEVAVLGLGGLGISHTRPSGLFWFLEAGGGVTSWVRTNNDEGARGHLQASLGVGTRR